MSTVGFVSSSAVNCWQVCAPEVYSFPAVIAQHGNYHLLCACLSLLVHPSEPAVPQQLLQALPTRWRAVLWHLLLAKDKAWPHLSCSDETEHGVVIPEYSITRIGVFSH